MESDIINVIFFLFINNMIHNDNTKNSSICCKLMKMWDPNFYKELYPVTPGIHLFVKISKFGVPHFHEFATNPLETSHCLLKSSSEAKFV